MRISDWSSDVCSSDLGVVPELASRDHVRKLLPLIRQTLAEAGLEVGDLDGVAYTAGPGLVGALLVGAGVARSLAWALDLPAVGVHHMEGHLLAPDRKSPSELQSLMRISYAVFCLKKKTRTATNHTPHRQSTETLHKTNR